MAQRDECNIKDQYHTASSFWVSRELIIHYESVPPKQANKHSTCFGRFMAVKS
jgi:hypothetical protein